MGGTPITGERYGANPAAGAGLPARIIGTQGQAEETAWVKVTKLRASSRGCRRFGLGLGLADRSLGLLRPHQLASHKASYLISSHLLSTKRHGDA
jgi:hypothetical protein